MENSYFWDAKKVGDTYDRTYNSDDFSKLFGGFWEDGIIQNSSTALLVEPLENSMAVIVNAGDALIRGRYYNNSEDRKLVLDVSQHESRIDFIALRFDRSKREIKLRVLKGLEGAGEPSYANTETIKDLILAKVKVPAHSTYLDDSMVEDCRGTNLAPWMNSTYSLDVLNQQFYDWFNNVKGTLEGDVAANLEREIQAVNTIAANNQMAIKANTDAIEALKQNTSMKSEIIDAIYPIGSIYLSANAANPSTFLGGSWKQITNGVLACAGTDGFAALGNSGGSNNISEAQLPSHTHTGTTSSAGAHTHTASSNKTGNHHHGTGWDADVGAGSARWGVHLAGVSGAKKIVNTGDAGSHSHTITVNSGGAHTHSFTTDATGSNKPFYPLHYSVNVWQRIG